MFSILLETNSDYQCAFEYPSVWSVMDTGMGRFTDRGDFVDERSVLDCLLKAKRNPIRIFVCCPERPDNLQNIAGHLTKRGITGAAVEVFVAEDAPSGIALVAAAPLESWFFENRVRTWAWEGTIMPGCIGG